LDKRPKRWNMDIRFGLWNVRSLYRAGSLMTVLRELSRYVRVSGSTGNKMGRRWPTNLLENTHFSTERGMRIMNYVQVVHKRIISAGKRVAFFSDRMLYIVLRGR
jgi:hypothetical protein